MSLVASASASQLATYKAQVEARMEAQIQMSALLHDQVKTEVDRKLRSIESESKAHLAFAMKHMEQQMEVQRQMFEARLEAQQRAFEAELERRCRPVTHPVAVVGGGSSAMIPNVVEVATALPVAIPIFPNVVEVLEEEPAVAPVADDKDRRIADLERKVALLTEAVVSFLAMKSEVEHATLSRCEAALPSYDAHGTFSQKGGSLCRPTGASFTCLGWGMASPPPIVTDGDAARAKAEWMDAFEELQATTVKTDTLIAALKE